MSGFIQGEDRSQATLFPERLDDYVAEDSAVRVIDVFIDELDLSGLGFKTDSNDTGRPPYHPATMLKLFVYGYLNRVQSSRRLETEAQRNVELMWLTGRLAPDFKTIADFAASSSCCPVSSTSSPMPSWPSTAASSRRSTTATATSRGPR
jgi:transposase